MELSCLQSFENLTSIDIEWTLTSTEIHRTATQWGAAMYYIWSFIHFPAVFLQISIFIWKELRYFFQDHKTASTQQLDMYCTLTYYTKYQTWFIVKGSQLFSNFLTPTLHSYKIYCCMDSNPFFVNNWRINIRQI